MFNNRARDRKAFWLTFRVIMGVAFFYAFAFFANEKFGEMTMRAISVIMLMIVNMVMITGDKKNSSAR